LQDCKLLKWLQDIKCTYWPLQSAYQFLYNLNIVEKQLR